MRAPWLLPLVLLAGCGGSSPEDGVRDTLHDYVAAVSARDGERLCGLLTGRPLSEARSGGACGLDGGGKVSGEDVETSGVHVVRDRAQATLKQGDTEVAVHLVHRDRWLIDRIEQKRLTFRIPSESMTPTYDVGDEVVVDLPAHELERGMVVLFQAPEGEGCANPRTGLGQRAMCDRAASSFSPGNRFVKRIVAVAGDEVAMPDGKLVINGRAEGRERLAKCDEPTLCAFPDAIEVPAGTVYVLGDNRGSSDDSRVFGPIPEDAVLGTVRS